MITDDALMAYLDGEADPDRARAIEQALAADSKLRTRLDGMAARDRTVRAAFDAVLERPTPDALSDHVRAAAARAGGNVVSLEARRSAAPRRWTWVAAALTARAAMLAGAFVLVAPMRQARAPAPDYTALSAAPAAQAANVMIMFRPDARESSMRETLASVEGRVVGGPNAAGAWMVHVPDAARDQALPRLRQRPDVRLAEPVDAR